MAEVTDPDLIAQLELPQSEINTPKAAKPPRPLPENAMAKIEEQVSALSGFDQAVNLFKDDYSGLGAGLENTLQGVTGLGTEGQRDWWASFRANDIRLRNAMFGASLTPGEQKSWEAVTISPNMAPSEIRTNLARRQKLARDMLARRAAAYKAGPYDQEMLAAALGEYDPDFQAPASVVNPGEVRFNDEAPERTEGRRFTPQQQAAWEALLRTKPTPQQIDSFLMGAGFGPGANSADVAAAAAKGLINPDPDYSRSDSEYRETLRREAEQKGMEGGLSALGGQGITLGLSDEASGLGGAISSLLMGRDPVKGYRRGRDTERVLIEDARDQTGWGGTAVEVGSGLLSGNPSAFARLPTLAARVRQGAKVGAKVGALAGYGYGDGAEGSTVSAFLGAAGGAPIGAAFPVAGAVIANRAGGFRSLFGNPGETAGRQIRNAFEADGISPRAAGRAMDEAQARGVPAMLADQGENLRNLLASVTRQPGASRALGLEAVTQRQLGQADRISGAIARDLGPVSNPHEVSEQLIEQARTTAAPLYDAFRAAPGASSVKLDDLAQRPAFREALKKAHGIIKEEGGDPTTLGFDLDEAGEVVLTRVPSWEALDYVKRGLDDVVYAKRNQLTGAPELTNETRAVNNTRRMLLSRMDAINPTYAEARAAYAGPVAGRDALERGLKALRLGADDITAQTRRMSAFELEQYRLGVRRAMTELVASKGDTADKISALTGSPRKREALQRLFGGAENFDRFMATLGDERAAQLTYQRAATGSPTALNGAIDLLTADTGLAESAIDSALRGSRDTLWGNVIALLQRARQAEQFGAGRAGQEARESIAAALSQTDATELRAVLREAARALAARRRVQNRGTSRNVRAAGRTGQLIGSGIGSSQEPEFERR